MPNEDSGAYGPMDRNPGKIIAAITAAIGVLTAMGVVVLSPEELDAINTFLIALAGIMPLLAGLWASMKMWAPRSKDVEAAKAFENGRGEGAADERKRFVNETNSDVVSKEEPTGPEERGLR